MATTTVHNLRHETLHPGDIRIDRRTAFGNEFIIGRDGSRADVIAKFEEIATLTPYHGDDIVVWPDGTWATLGEVRSGEFSYMSDDFEIVRLEDVARLKELGLADELDIS